MTNGCGLEKETGGCMLKIKMTEYTFEVSKRITVRVYGGDTEENQEKAEREAIRQIKEDIEDCIELYDINEDEDYENEYGEAV